MEEFDASEVHSLSDIKVWQDTTFIDNFKRQTSVIYGYAGLKKFLDTNDLAFVLRAHEVVDDGYKVLFLINFEFRNIISILIRFIVLHCSLLLIIVICMKIKELYA